MTIHGPYASRAQAISGWLGGEPVTALTAALANRGVTLGAFDQHVLATYARSHGHADVLALIGMFERAYAAGQTAARTSPISFGGQR